MSSPPGKQFVPRSRGGEAHQRAGSWSRGGRTGRRRAGGKPGQRWGHRHALNPSCKNEASPTFLGDEAAARQAPEVRAQHGRVQHVRGWGRSRGWGRGSAACGAGAGVDGVCGQRTGTQQRVHGTHGVCGVRLPCVQGTCG